MTFTSGLLLFISVTILILTISQTSTTNSLRNDGEHVSLSRFGKTNTFIVCLIVGFFALCLKVNGG